MENLAVAVTAIMNLLDAIFDLESANGSDAVAEQVMALKEECGELTPYGVGERLFDIYDEEVTRVHEAK